MTAEGYLSAEDAAALAVALADAHRRGRLPTGTALRVCLALAGASLRHAASCPGLAVPLAQALDRLAAATSPPDGAAVRRAFEPLDRALVLAEAWAGRDHPAVAGLHAARAAHALCLAVQSAADGDREGLAAELEFVAQSAAWADDVALRHGGRPPASARLADAVRAAAPWAEAGPALSAR